jgi:uncharacterized lipoprotein YddW (UPF0748 family)
LKCFVLVAAAAMGVPGCASGGGTKPGVFRHPPRPLPEREPIRAVWVARFHYRYADDVTTIMRNCAALGFNTVLWQVRGEATLAYPSDYEPWGREFGFADPGFDPLELAVREAHANGLRIEAWVNVMPGWRGKTPPPMPEQIYNRCPEWFMYDVGGRRQPLNDDYVIVNPCLPEVREHVVLVFRDLVQRYDVDGLHLDYVRYAWEGTPDARTRYPGDPRTLELYARQTGLTPAEDPAAWDHWRANQLTRLAQEIRSMLEQERPGATLTAAVWRDPVDGYRSYLQNAAAWLRAGLLDAAMPMAYAEQVSDVVRSIESYRIAAPGKRIVPGLGIYKHKSAEQIRAQLTQCTQWGGDFALFSYESLEAVHGDRAKKPDAKSQRERQMRRDAVLQATSR